MKKNIAIVYGGYSSEEVVSRKSVEGLLTFIDTRVYNLYPVLINKAEWAVVLDGNKYPIDKNDFSAVVDGSRLTFDCVYVTIHGTPGENGLLQGYEENPPAGFALPEGSYYNKYFPGHAINMPKPLSDGQVTFDDGSPATVAQYAKDVTTFLMWTAEPHMEARKRLGLQVFVFLILLTGLLYFTKKKIWANAQ